MFTGEVTDLKMRILNVASVLLFIVGILGLFTALQELFMAGSVDEGLLGVTVSQIRAFSPNLMDKVTLLQQFSGLYLLSMALFFCVTSLIPYRKGEKWAWYLMLVVGGLGLLTQLVLVYINTAVLGAIYLPASIILVISWDSYSSKRNPQLNAPRFPQNPLLFPL
jgi:hypothetical protein